MKIARWAGSAMAVALIGVGGLTVTQFAATQETQPPKQAEPAPQDAAKAPQTDKDAEKATPTRRGLSTFMHMKLDASQKILAGLALEDFELIQEGAGKLQEMSAAAKWRVTNDAFYREHSADFQKMVQRLSKNAKEEKLDGSALAWIEVTMQCIECHKWTRAHLIADRPDR